MIKILFADSHVLVREGFERIVERELDMSVIHTCQNSDEVLDFVDHHHCDLMVLDTELSGKNTLDLLLDVNRLTPQTKVIVLSVFTEEHFALRAITAGAAGYTTKEATIEDLIQAIRKVHLGRTFVPPGVADYITRQLRFGALYSHERLSNREFQVLKLIGTGKSVGEISGNLSLSSNTVNTYRKRIFEKLGLSSSSELIHYAMRNRIVL